MQAGNPMPRQSSPQESETSIQRLMAVVEYDGTDYLGFQLQASGATVQGEIERALAAVTQEEIRIIGAGRTDAGVHARGQVIAFSTAWRHSIEELQRALNAVLPEDIGVRELRPVAEIKNDIDTVKAIINIIKELSWKMGSLISKS